MRRWTASIRISSGTEELLVLFPVVFQHQSQFTGDLLLQPPGDELQLAVSKEEKPATLSECVGRMKPDQKVIYYACGQSREQLEHLPQTELAVVLEHLSGDIEAEVLGIHQALYKAEGPNW